MRRTMLLFGVALLGSVAVAGCHGHDNQAAAGPVGIPTPHANQADLAIAAVKSYKPPGSTESIGSFYGAAATLGTALGNTYKEIGWGAEPQGSSWIVTHTYIGSAGTESAAVWRVTLGKPSIVQPQNDKAVDAEKHAKSLADSTGPAKGP